MRLQPKPTDRQQEVLDWMVSFCLTHHSPPTYADIAEGFGLPHRNGMVSTVRSLRRKGLVDQYALRPVCVEYSTHGQELTEEGVLAIDIVTTNAGETVRRALKVGWTEKECAMHTNAMAVCRKLLSRYPHPDYKKVHDTP